MNDLLLGLLHKIQQGLPEVKARSIHSLASKLNHALILPSHLLYDDSLAYALLSYLNDFQDKASPDTIIKALSLLSVMARLEEGCILLDGMETRQFLQGLSKYLRLLELIYQINQRITEVVGHSVVTRDHVVQCIQVKTDLLQQSPVQKSTCKQVECESPLLDLPMFQLSDGDDKILNDLEVQLKYSDRKKLFDILQRIHAVLKDLPVECLRSRNTLVKELVNLFKKPHYQFQIGRILHTVIKKAFRARQLYKRQRHVEVGLIPSTATKSHQLSQLRYPYINPQFGTSKLFASFSDIFYSLRHTLHSPLSLDWLRCVSPSGVGWVDWVQSLSEVQVCAAVHPQLIRICSELPEEEFARRAMEGGMRQAVCPLLQLRSLQKVNNKVLEKMQTIINLFASKQLQAYKKSLLSKKQYPHPLQVVHKGIQPLLDSLLGLALKRPTEMESEVVQMYVEMLIKAEDRQLMKAKEAFLEVLGVGDLQQRVMQELIDLLQNEKQIEGQSSSERLFALLDEQFLDQILDLILKDNTLMALQLLDIVGRYAELPFLSKYVPLLYILQVGHSLKIKSNKLANKLAKNTVLDGKLAPLINLFAKDKPTSEEAFLLLTGKSPSQPLQIPKGRQLQPQQISAAILLIKDPTTPLVERIQSCDAFIKEPVPSHFTRYCHYELQRGVQKILEGGEEVALFQRFAFFCEDECWSFQLGIALLPTAARTQALSVLKRKIFQSPMKPWHSRQIAPLIPLSDYSQLHGLCLQEQSHTQLQDLPSLSVHEESSLDSILDYLLWNNGHPQGYPITRTVSKAVLRHLSIYLARMDENPLSISIAMHLLKKKHQSFLIEFCEYVQHLLISTFYEAVLRPKEKVPIINILSLIARLIKSSSPLILNKLKVKLYNDKMIKAMAQLCQGRDGLVNMSCLNYVQANPSLMFGQQSAALLLKELIISDSLLFHQSYLTSCSFSNRLIHILSSFSLQIQGTLPLLTRHLENPHYLIRARAWHLLSKQLQTLSLQQAGVLSELGWSRLQSGQNYLVWCEVCLFCQMFLRQSSLNAPTDQQQTFCDKNEFLRQRIVDEVITAGVGGRLLSVLMARQGELVGVSCVRLLGELCLYREQLGDAVAESEVLSFLVANSLEQETSQVFIAVLWQLLTALLNKGNIKPEQLLTCTRLTLSLTTALHRHNHPQLVEAATHLLSTLLHTSPGFTIFSFSKLAEEQADQPQVNLIYNLFRILPLVDSHGQFLNLLATVCQEWRRVEQILDQQEGHSRILDQNLKQLFRWITEEHENGTIDRSEYLGRRLQAIKMVCVFISHSNQCKGQMIELVSTIIKELTAQDLSSGNRSRTKDCIELLRCFFWPVDGVFRHEKAIPESIWHSFEKLYHASNSTDSLRMFAQLLSIICHCGWAGRLLYQKMQEAKITLLKEMLNSTERSVIKDQNSKVVWKMLSTLLDLSQIRNLFVRTRAVERILKRTKKAISEREVDLSWLKLVSNLIAKLASYQELAKRFLAEQQFVDLFTQLMQSHLTKQILLHEELPIFINLCSHKENRQSFISSKRLLPLLLRIIQSSNSEETRMLACQCLYNMTYKNYDSIKALGKEEVEELLEEQKDGAGEIAEKILRGIR